ncbi:uncharacterized protein MONOS_18230 [Monocercomonoides exilis]|uniref:uncharacterized protein n=1 Tax=Monocercomonoides exilis TaxID=2049356 RepID=UPI00355A1167|nr:hypothetical protein MONOS_18230 [Monocercomonoides exilis]
MVFGEKVGFVEKERELGVGQWRKRVEQNTQQASTTMTFAFCTKQVGKLSAKTYITANFTMDSKNKKTSLTDNYQSSGDGKIFQGQKDDWP